MVSREGRTGCSCAAFFVIVKVGDLVNAETEKKLASSLTAETTELLPFLPYLLQDLWMLGTDPELMASLIERHIRPLDGIRVLDLACGKGPVAVTVAKRLGVRVKGIDLMPEFIEVAAQKAEEAGAAALCDFSDGDINEAVAVERGYDCVILGAVSGLANRAVIG